MGKINVSLFCVYQRVHYIQVTSSGHLTSSLHHLPATDEGGGADILAAIGTSRVGPIGYVVAVEQRLRL